MATLERKGCYAKAMSCALNKRALHRGPPHDDGEEGGVRRAWRRIKAAYKGHSERALGFLPWMAMKNEHFNRLLRCGLWKIIKAFKVGLDVGLWPSAANLDSSLTRALKRPFLCSVSKGHVWFNFGLHGQKAGNLHKKHNGLFHRFNSYCWCIL